MNTKWEYKKIGYICIVERGGSPRPIDQYITDSDDGINWIKIGDTTESMYITEAAQKIKPEGMKKSRYVQPGDFLLSNSMSFGRPYILKIDGCIHDGWLVLRDKNELFDKRFLYYYLSSKTTFKKFKGMAVGGVVNNLNSEMVRKVDVPVPVKREQINIADLLDKLNAVIGMRQRELQKLDNLIKARFVEMFGHPLINSLGLETKPMTEVCEIIDGDRGKNYPTADEFTDEGYCLFLNAKNVTASGFNFDTCMFVSKEKDEVLRKGKLSRGDVVLTTRGTLGNLAFYTDDIPFEHVRINSGMVILRMKQELVNEVYFIEQFKMQLADIKKKIASGSAQPQLPISTMNKIQILIPDIEIQKQFAAFVTQVAKSKVAVQKALDETQLLFDSLMQQYFG